MRAGDGTHYDEVTITITAPPPPAGAKPTREEGAGEAAPAIDAPADQPPAQPASEQAPAPQSAPPQDQGTPPATT